jgi:hypothetical protein
MHGNKSNCGTQQSQRNRNQKLAPKLCGRGGFLRDPGADSPSPQIESEDLIAKHRDYEVIAPTEYGFVLLSRTQSPIHLNVDGKSARADRHTLDHFSFESAMQIRRIATQKDGSSGDFEHGRARNCCKRGVHKRTLTRYSPH